MTALRRVMTSSSAPASARSEEHTSELQSQSNLVCRLLLEKKKRRQLKSQLPQRREMIPPLAVPAIQGRCRGQAPSFTITRPDSGYHHCICTSLSITRCLSV